MARKNSARLQLPVVEAQLQRVNARKDPRIEARKKQASIDICRFVTASMERGILALAPPALGFLCAP
jgi:hypothetical protein